MGSEVWIEFSHYSSLVIRREAIKKSNSVAV